jgi:hypothetical protein
MRGKVQAANKRAEEEKERRTDLHWNAKFPLLGAEGFEKRESAIKGSSITYLAHPKCVDPKGGDDRASCDPPPKRARHQPSGV